MNHMNPHPMGPMPYGHGPMGYHPPVPHHHGFCSTCCHPVSKCCCHRQCRKEAKELLVRPAEKEIGRLETGVVSHLLTVMNPMRMAASTGGQSPAGGLTEEGVAGSSPEGVLHLLSNVSSLAGTTDKLQIQLGQGTAVIGGGCCVHLSVEYMPSKTAVDVFSGGTTGTIPSVVVIYVMDSAGTVLAWGKVFESGYHIKEGIITTNPGAQLLVLALNAIARVRWCEIFSC